MNKFENVSSEKKKLEVELESGKPGPYELKTEDLTKKDQGGVAEAGNDTKERFGVEFQISMRKEKGACKQQRAEFRKTHTVAHTKQ